MGMDYVAKNVPPFTQLGRLIQAATLLIACAAAVARAESPPIDPWSDAAWQDALYGLSPGQVARVSATQQLFDVQSAAAGVLSTREAQFEFEGPGGRVVRLVLRHERRHEPSSHRSFRYVYEGALLQRIDEDGQATPALVRRYDAAGRPIEQAERTGAVVARTTWRYDAAGRVIEHVVDSGTGSRVRQMWLYRRDGTLERLQSKNGRLFGKTVDFDKDERPVRIQVTDLFERHETVVTYPSPTEAIQTTTGFTVGRGGGRYEYTNQYRVRTPQELRRVEAPELPTLRRHDRGGRRTESLTEYDAAGRIVAEHQLDAAGAVACTGRITYHPSGPPLAIRNESASAGAPCAVSGVNADNEVQADERGHWIEQRMTLLRPDGQRRPMSVQTRRIEYRP